MKKIFLILTVLSSMNLFSNNPDWTYQLCMGADITYDIKQGMIKEKN